MKHPDALTAYFYANARPTRVGCLEWTGPYRRAGFPRAQAYALGVDCHAARLAYCLDKGLPLDTPGYIIRTCRNQKCVSARHLQWCATAEEATRASNVTVDAKDTVFNNSARGTTEMSCWEWVGGVDIDGYGHITYHGRKYRAHRLSYAAYNDLDPASLDRKLVIRHLCDNPRCVNPAHLSLGTAAENMADKVIRNRARGGGRAKLTDDSVRALHARYVAGEAIPALADEAGVTRQGLRHRFKAMGLAIINRDHPDKKLTDEDVREIVRVAYTDQSASVRATCAAAGVTVATFRQRAKVLGLV